MKIGRLAERVGLYAFVILVAWLMAQPFIWMVLTSFKELEEVHRFPIS